MISLYLFATTSTSAGKPKHFLGLTLPITLTCFYNTDYSFKKLESILISRTYETFAFPLPLEICKEAENRIDFQLGSNEKLFTH